VTFYNTVPISRIFRNEKFGYRTITVERPQRDETGKVVLAAKGKGKGKPVPDADLKVVTDRILTMIGDCRSTVARSGERQETVPPGTRRFSELTVRAASPASRLRRRLRIARRVRDVRSCLRCITAQGDR
jgi:hypothetical protein